MLLEQQNKKRLLNRKSHLNGQEQERPEASQSHTQRQKVPADRAQAITLPMQAGIDPSRLTLTQLEPFLAQGPHLQKKSVQVYTQNMATQHRNTVPQGMPSQGLSASKFFANEERDNVREENPGITSGIVILTSCFRGVYRTDCNVHFTGQTGKVLGVGWNALNTNARKQYEAKTKSDKERYSSEKMSQDQHMGDTADDLDCRASGQKQDMGDTANMPDCIASGNMYSLHGTLPWNQQVCMLTNHSSSQGDDKTVAAEAVGTKFYQGQPSAISPDDSHLYSVTSLLATIEKLENENQTLQKLAVHRPSPRWQELYRVTCDDQETQDVFLDVPSLLSTGDRETHLQGRLRISDVALYCERHADISFVVYKNYICHGHGHRVRKKGAPHGRRTALIAGSEQEAYKSGESLSIVSHILCEALDELVGEDVQRKKRYPDFDLYSEIEGPYLFYYHDRAFVERKVAHMKEDYRTQLNTFTNYICDSFGMEYKEVDELFAQGLVSSKYFKYLFVPNIILISHAKDQDMAHILETWPEWNSPSIANPNTNQKQEFTPQSLVKVSSWDFDGSFQKISTMLTIQYGALSGEVKPIRDMDIYPLQYADRKVEISIRDRGRKFWQCRFQNYVCYNGSDASHEEDNVWICCY